jgi:Histidine kinase-, DNA gyrase B-, and HSP90-like ATPase
MTRTEMIPSARRLMESLRDIGYDLPAAVADLVDNSVDAEAESVWIDARHGPDGGWIRISDDGVGMTERHLDEAMRYGSSRHYDDDDLGHFGLGLKTASLSQGRRLTVATRSSRKGPIRIRRWDLDHVARTDSWNLESLTVREAPKALTEPLSGRTGTVVMWQHLDRVFGNRRPGGDAAARRLQEALGEIGEHLSMVFHRFMSGEAPGPKLRIHVDGTEMNPWDPFARSEPLTRTMTPQTIPFEFCGVQHGLVVQPFVLPTQQHFSSPETHERASGPNRWNRQQGLYVYRRDRLIQSGGWNRLRTLDEHAKLARIAIDIPPGADAAFRINVSKMTVGLPDAVRPQLRALIAGVVSNAQDAYRRRLVLVSGDADVVVPSNAVTIGDQWPQIQQVLTLHLKDQPEVLDRILLALANSRPTGVVQSSVVA